MSGLAKLETMRASRLLSILMVLQARGRVTAQDLAAECEVSLRTIYRDVDALSAAGIPVYSDRGAAGGYRLLDGYRTRLNGLSAEEASALFLSGLPGPAASLGLGSAMLAAQLKLAVALPNELRATAERMRQCFHLDAPGWFHSAEEPEHLQRVATAIWQERQIEIRYRSWKSERQRRLIPLGIVLKSGAWYLIGAVTPTEPRTYRIARIRDLTILPDRFTRPPDFDLAAHWQASTQRLEAELYPNRAIIRLSPIGFRLLEPFTSPYIRANAAIGEPDGQGYRIVTIPVGSIWQASSDLLRFGPEVEVIEPAELRAKMSEIGRQLMQTYTGLQTP
jgi:predicted DNA-binding transcriptional regulator YafY